MAKLRKMLGHVDDPQVKALMALIETQSKATLGRWAAGYTQANYLPLYEKAFPSDFRFHEIFKALREHLDGHLPMTKLKPHLREGAQLARSVEDPAIQAAARAMATACGTIQTPTNALGFTFYGAAAAAYSQAGLNESPEEYDRLAQQELDKILDSLQSTAVEDEPDPVKIKWGC